MMTALEHQELKGITIKNLVVTILSTASIVASVMTTYFGLKTDIMAVKASQETEARVNNLRLKILEEQVNILQKEVDEINRGQEARGRTARIKTQENGIKFQRISYKNPLTDR